MNGSTDNRHLISVSHRIFGTIMGCDGSQKVEGYTSDITLTTFLMGYITDGAVFYDNAPDYSIVAVGAWTDLAALPADAVMGFFEISNFPFNNWDLRENGSAMSYIDDGSRQNWQFVKCDASKLIEGYISGAGTDFLLNGYATGGAGAIPSGGMANKMIAARLL
jgi:hypothetical protein